MTGDIVSGDNFRSGNAWRAVLPGAASVFATAGRAVRALPVLLVAIALLAPGIASAQAAARTVEVKMMMSPDGSQVYFDPVGIHIAAGDTVRWIQISNYHSVTAYDPSNDNHEKRIPDGARPWDSGVLIAEYPAKGSSFSHTFTVEGVYDYYCIPHEAAGMVGRIVVGKAGDGPGTRAFGYAPQMKWKPVPAAAQAQFPAVAEILARGSVHSPHAAAARPQ